MNRPFKFKAWIGMLVGALLMMTFSVANAGTSRTPLTNTPMTQSGEAKHRHPQGPPGKGPRRYLEHKDEAHQASESAGKAIRRGPPGKTPYGHRREVEEMPSPEREEQ